MTRIGSPRESREPASIAHGRQHYLRVSDVAPGATRVASGCRGMTRYVYGRKFDIIVCTFGTGMAGAGRRRPLSRLASAYGARKRPGRSEEAILCLLATGLGRSGDFGGGEGCSPQTTIRLRLARGDHRAAPDRGRVSSGEVAGRHPDHAPAVLFGYRLGAWILCHETTLAASACQDRLFVGVPSSAGDRDIALCAPRRPPSLSGGPYSRAWADQTSGSLGSGRFESFGFRQSQRHEVRAFDAPAPHHQREPTASVLRFPTRAPSGRGERP